MTAVCEPLTSCGQAEQLGRRGSVSQAGGAAAQRSGQVSPGRPGWGVPAWVGAAWGKSNQIRDREAPLKRQEGPPGSQERVPRGTGRGWRGRAARSGLWGPGGRSSHGWLELNPSGRASGLQNGLAATDVLSLTGGRESTRLWRPRAGMDWPRRGIPEPALGGQRDHPQSPGLLS